MIENNPLNVPSAFDSLLEGVEAEIEFINHIGARAFEGRSLEKAKEALERSGLVTAFRDKVAALRKEWDELAAAAQREEDEETQSERRNLGRLRRGQRTPESAYYLPILRALAEMGGAGRMQDVVERLEKLMKSTLRKVDYEPLASNPETKRWRNTAQWARATMVKDGLLKSDAPRGVWEISSAGRERLNQG